MIGFRQRRPRRDPLIPYPFIGDESTLIRAFIEIAKRYKDNEKEAIQRYTFLPDPIKDAWVWYDKITEMWRYNFGPPYDRMPGDMLVAGTSSNFPVEELYIAIKIADERMIPSQLITYRERLAQFDKHAAALFEMRPLKNVKRDLRARYEVTGLGEGKTSVDWQVKSGLLNIIFDVKYRIKSLLDHLRQTIPTMNAGSDTAMATAPNPEDLFKSSDRKFRRAHYLRRQQGLWVSTEIQEDKEKLQISFNKELSKRKIHFLIISDWKDDAYILARNRFLVSALKRTFCLKESERFVTRDYDKVAVERAN